MDSAKTIPKGEGRTLPPLFGWKKRLPNLLLFLVFGAGLTLLLYPTVADYWNSLTQTKTITNYVEDTAGMTQEEMDAILDAARTYNRRIYENGTNWKLSEEELAEYNSLLATGTDGVMGVVEIPKIDVTLPIYHGTGDAALQSGAGHLEGSSLPVGGENTHAVLSSHRGLVSAKLFTDLDKLTVGDTFTITVLNEVLTYEVEQINIVLPTEMASLTVQEGEELCTLVTCTPYGINTHRLLVTGRRADTASHEKIAVPGDALQLESNLIAPMVAAPILLILLILMLFKTRRHH